MIIKLPATQISNYWEIIKFSATKADNVSSDDLQPYLNELLNSLLSGKSQCFFRIDKKERKILSLMVTQIVLSKITGKKFLNIKCLYSFVKAEDREWQRDFEIIKDFFKKQNCVYAKFTSNNPRIWDITKKLGFKELNREFIFK